MTAAAKSKVAVETARIAKERFRYYHEVMGTRDADELTTAEWKAMYLAQCECTDEWAEKYQAIKDATADATLLARIAELERALETVNRHLIAAQGLLGP